MGPLAARIESEEYSTDCEGTGFSLVAEVANYTYW